MVAFAELERPERPPLRGDEGPEVFQAEERRHDERTELREELEHLTERLEALALEGLPDKRVRAREAAVQTLDWAITQGRLPAQIRDYPHAMALLRMGLLAHLANKNQSHRPFQVMDRRMRWDGMAGLSALRLACPDAGMDQPPRAMPPSVRPEDLTPLDTIWPLDGRKLRLGEMTGAQMRRKADRALRLALGNERTFRLFDALSQGVADNQQAAEVLDDDRAYQIAVEVLGEDAALTLLGRRTGDGPPAEDEAAHEAEAH